MARFASAADLASLLQRPFTDEETATAELLLDLTSAAIRSATKQTIDRVLDDAATLAAPAGATLVLPELPVEAAPTLVEVGGVAVTDWTFDGIDTLYRAAGWRAWDPATGAPLRVAVTYTHGYATIPDDIRRICLQAAARAMRNPEGIRSEGIGAYNRVYSVPVSGTVTDVSLTDQEKREARAALGLPGTGRAFSVGTVPVA